VIGGWSPSRKDHGWGLLVGELDEAGGLSFRGRVEYGFAPGDREDLERIFLPLERSASCFIDARTHHDDVYVEPSLTAEIRYLEQTSAGLLRHATFRQLGGRWS
jgi:bifunctional non-homologous end joining protein LigD